MYCISAGINAIVNATNEANISNIVEQVDSISDILYDDLRPSEKAAYDGYSENGWKGKYSGQEPRIKAGGKFYNIEGKLPVGSYREFDINSPDFNGVRDASRFVVDENLNAYLTRDHYKTFYRVVKKGG